MSVTGSDKNCFMPIVGATTVTFVSAFPVDSATPSQSRYSLGDETAATICQNSDNDGTNKVIISNSGMTQVSDADRYTRKQPLCQPSTKVKKISMTTSPERTSRGHSVSTQMVLFTDGTDFREDGDCGLTSPQKNGLSNLR